MFVWELSSFFCKSSWMNVLLSHCTAMYPSIKQKGETALAAPYLLMLCSCWRLFFLKCSTESGQPGRRGVWEQRVKTPALPWCSIMSLFSLDLCLSSIAHGFMLPSRAVSRSCVVLRAPSGLRSRAGTGPPADSCKILREIIDGFAGLEEVCSLFCG